MFINTEKPLKLNEEYQYKESGFIADVKLVEDASDNEYWKFGFKILSATHDPYSFDMLDDDGILRITMLKGNFYYPTMPRIWDKDEYAFIPLGGDYE